jgi:hypothetical protein
MVILKVPLLITLLAFTGFSQAQEPKKQGETIIGTKVSLKPPEGFTPSPQFPGYWLESLSSSIMVTEFPNPFAEASAGFSNSSELMKRGVSLLNAQEVKLNGQSGLLVKVKQNAFGTEYLKWLLIFGDEKESVMIAATFPKELDGDLSEKMKASILTATWDRKKDVSPTEGLNFRVDEKGELKLAKRIANLLAFSKRGIFPSKDVDDPVFIVGQSVSKMEIGNPEGFAKARILQTAEIKDVEIEQSNKVTIDHLNGYEIVAKGKDKASARPMVVYQVMLFDGQSYFLMQGLISDRNRQLNLELFKEMARTFHRKKS